MFADYHVHTEFSDDSVYPMGQVIADAIAMHMDAEKKSSTEMEIPLPMWTIPGT